MQRETTETQMNTDSELVSTSREPELTRNLQVEGQTTDRTHADGTWEHQRPIGPGGLS